MGAIGEFNTTLLNAANTVTGVLSDYAKNKSDFQLSTNSINFNSELQNEITALSRTEGWEKEQFYDESGKAYGLGKSEWEKQIDEWYNTKLSELDNSDSPYFAHNNYERRAMTEMIMQSKASAAAKLEQMAYQKTVEKMIVDAQNGIQKLTGMLQGQEFIDAANEYIKPLKDYLTTKQYDEWIKSNFQTGYMAYYNNKFSAAFDTAIAEDKNFTTLSNEIFKDDSLKLYGSDGLEIKMDKEMLQNSVKKVEEQNYNSKLIEVQTANYKGHEQRFNKIDDTLLDIIAGKSTDYQSVYNDCNVGLYVLKNQGGLQLAKGEQSTLSDKYVRYMDTIKNLQKTANAGSGKDNLKSYETTIIKGTPETFARAVAEGKLTPYAAEESLQKIFFDEYFGKEWSETKNMTKEDKETFYLLKYQNTAAQKLLSDKALNEIAESKYPAQYSYLKTLKKELEKDSVRDPVDRIYTADTAATMTSFLLDCAAEGMDNKEFAKKWDSMLKACTVEGLDGLFEKRGFRESYNNEIVRLVDDMYNNDVIFTDTNGKEIWAGGETTKEKYDEASKKIRSFIEQNIDGVTLSQPIYKKTLYDIEPIPEFKGSDGNVYHVETVENGKQKELVIVDQNGNKYAVKDLNAEDKAAKKASNKNIKEQKNVLFEAEEKAAEETENMLMNTKNIPNKVAASGSVTAQDWKDTENNTRLRYYQMNAAIGEIDKMAKNTKVSEEEFRSKFGLTKREWQNMKGQTTRYKYLMS